LAKTNQTNKTKAKTFDVRDEEWKGKYRIIQ
jgi:hypothetical protein